MRYIYNIIAALAICLMTFPADTTAQCKQYAETEVMPLLGEYIISGRYNTLKLREGEEILIFKTLSKGIDYRIIVKGEDSLSSYIHYTIKDWEDNTIYDNDNGNHDYKWDYKSEKTQRIKINVFVPKTSQNPPLREGCVTVLTGIKPDM